MSRDFDTDDSSSFQFAARASSTSSLGPSLVTAGPLLHNDTTLKSEQCRRVGVWEKMRWKTGLEAGQPNDLHCFSPILHLVSLWALRKQTDEENQQDASKPNTPSKQTQFCVLGIGNGIHVEFVASGVSEPIWTNYLNKTDKVGWLYKEDKVTSKYF